MEETVNQRIRRLRKRMGYSQKDVAKMLGLKTSTYSQMERIGKITSELLIKLTVILQTDALTLLYGDNKPKTIIPNINEFKKDIDGIPFLVAQDIYEKFAVIAMRNLLPSSKQEVYEFIIDKLKNIDELKFYKQ